MLVVLVVVVAAAGAYIWVQSRTFEATITGLRDEVLDPGDPSAGMVELPEIVRAYATRAGGSVGGPPSVHIRHQAMLTTDRARPAMRIEADQWLASYKSNLVWRGGGSMHGVPVTVVDSFVKGSGLLEARLAGTLPVAAGTGPAFDKGELQRYLSELPVHPDAILNNAELSWRQLSDYVVEVTGSSNSGTASVTFFFDGAGDIAGMEASDRPMSVGKTTVATPWKGSFGRYKQFGRYRIPSYGEVGWALPDGLFTYWRGELISYEPATADLRPIS